MKSKNTILMIAFFALFGLFILKKTVLKAPERSFKSTLTNIDISDIDQLTLQAEGTNSPLIQLRRENNEWQLSQDNQSTVADSSIVEGLIKQLAHIKTKQLVAKTKDKWSAYELDDSKAKVVSLFHHDKLLAKLMIGKFDFNPNTRSGLSYVRLNQDEDVYAIDGFLAAGIPKDFNGFRKTKLVNTAVNEISHLDLNMEDKHWSATKSDGQWSANVAIDSTKISQYLQKIAQLKGHKFAENEKMPPGAAIAELNISSAENTNLCSIKAYRNNDKEFVLKSNQNDAYFASDSSGIFKTIFLDWKDVVQEVKN